MKALRTIIVGLLCLMLFFTYRSNNNYMELLEVTDSYITALDSQRKSYNSMYEMWEEDYDKLLNSYGQLLVDYSILESKLGEIEIPVYDFTEAEIYMLAQCVEAEAGHYKNHYLSQQYVTQVILNRLHSSEFPNKIEEVIYQKVKGVPQFSVAYDGAMNDREVQPETLANVYYVIVHGTDLPEYVCYFYSEKVTENWVNKLNVYDTVQGTVFAYE